MRQLTLLLLLCPFIQGQTIHVTGGKPVSKTTEIYKGTVDAVVQVETMSSDGAKIGQGSGFLVSADGKIVTNHHVIAGAAKAQVRLANGAVFPVDYIVADDDRQDITILKVSGQRLPFLKVHEGQPDIGERIVVIGSPLGLQNSISEGIISGFRVHDDVNWIQTTAAASPGNSGGPLIDENMEVAGVITWKLVRGESLNFAVPSDAVRRLLSLEGKILLGEASRNVPTTSEGKTSQVWTSLSSGRDYKVRSDGEYMYTEWIVPTAYANTPMFMRGELKKNGSGWIGKTHLYEPFKQKYGGYKWCHLEIPIQFTSVTDRRIEGRALRVIKMDAGKCELQKSVEEPFTWIPKE